MEGLIRGNLPGDLSQIAKKAFLRLFEGDTLSGGGGIIIFFMGSKYKKYSSNYASNTIFAIFLFN